MSRRLSEQVALDLANIAKLRSQYAELIKASILSEPAESERALLAHVMHSFYNGVENAIKRILLECDSTLPGGDRWHAELLKLAAADSSARPAVISTDLHKSLLEYMGFRHAYRHSYPFDIRWEKIQDLVTNFENVSVRFEAERNRFLDRMPKAN